MEKKTIGALGNITVVGGIVFLVQLVQYLLGRMENSFLLGIGVFLLYVTVFAILYSLQKIFSMKDWGLFAFLGFLFIDSFQKHEYVFRETWKKSHYFRNINYGVFLLFGIFFFYLWMKQRKMEWKELFFVENIRNYFLYLLPFFILRGRQDKVLIYFIVIALLCFFYKKEWKQIAEVRKKAIMGTLVLLYLLSSYISRVNGLYSRFGDEIFYKELLYYIFFLVLLLIPISKEMLQKIRFSLLFSAIYPVSLGLIEWTSNHYSIYKAIGTEEWTSVWAVRAVLISLMYFFFYLYERKSILLFLACISTLTMLLSQGRGPLLSFLLSFSGMIFLYCHYSKKKKYFYISILFLGVLLFLLFETDNFIIYKIKLAFSGHDNSTNTRMILYKGAIEQWKNSKYFGHGLGTLEQTAKNMKESLLLAYDLGKIPHAHDNTLELLRSLGLVGLASYAALRLYMLWNFLKGGVIAILPLILLVSFELSGVTDYTLMMFRSHLLLLFIAGVWLSFHENHENKIVF